MKPVLFTALFFLLTIFSGCDIPGNVNPVAPPVSPVDGESGHLVVTLNNELEYKEAYITFVIGEWGYEATAANVMQKRINLINENGTTGSKQIEMLPGTYWVYEFVVIDEQEHTVSASPGRYDDKLEPVDNPLPIRIKIDKNTTKTLELETVDVPPDDPIVVFTNEELEGQIRYQNDEFYEYSYLHVSEIEKINELSLQYGNLTTLSEIEKLKNLTKLSIRCNKKIDDFTPLTKLTVLDNLNIDEADFSDADSMDFLAGIISLKNLDIGDSLINDINTICDLEALISLSLPYNEIDEISGISRLVNLKYLDLGDNDIDHNDLIHISGMLTLETLKLAYNNIESFVNLANLTSLKHLNLRNNGFRVNLQPLSNLTNLEELNLAKNYITDISPLSALINLKDLNLIDNYINYIRPLVTLLENKNADDAAKESDLRIVLVRNHLQYSLVADDVTALRNDPHITLVIDYIM